MPLRDYHCPDCGRSDVDVLEEADAPLLECASCGATMRRKIGRVSVKVASSSSRSTTERADWGDYTHRDMADTAIATEAAYEVARKSGLDEDRARASARVAGDAMQSAGEALIENQRNHAAELAAAEGSG